MRRLIALDISGGPTFLKALQQCFEAGDAVLPLDQRLSPNAKKLVTDAMRPWAVWQSDEQPSGGASGLILQHKLANSVPVEEGDALVVTTSGSTGAPKGVVLTRSAIEASAFATSKRLEVDASRDRWLCCLPLAHVGGLSILLRSIFTNTEVEIIAKFDRDIVLAAARERGATLISVVPTTLRRLAGPHPLSAIGSDETRAFRKIILGGSVPPPELPDNVVYTYGMTETGSGVAYDGFGLDTMEIAIAGPPGQAGQIMLRGPMLFRNYRGNDIANQDRSRTICTESPFSPDGWFATGDWGELSENGKLTVYGRIVDVITTGGEQVWPIAVEAVISRHEAINEVAVVGHNDQEWGERVVAYLVLNPGWPAPTLEQLKEIISSEIAPWAAPKELFIIDSLPKTAIGKVIRKALQQ